MLYLIKVGSITNAQRGQAVLKSYGYRATVRKVEKPSKEDGCGWALEVRAGDDSPVKILSAAGINVRSVSRA